MSAVIPKVSKLSSRVIRVLGCNPSLMTLQGTNTYLIGSGKSRLLVDCGEPNVPLYINSLKQVIDENEIKLSQIIITHWHYDHIGGLPDVLHALQLNDTDCKIQKLCNEEHDKQYVNSFKINYLTDGQIIEMEGMTLRVVATPGHTTDHLVLVLEEENAVFSGDCILGEGSAVFEELYSYMKSLNIILDLKPSVIYPGHGPVICDPIHKIKEYIAHRQQREEQIIEVLKSENKPLSPLEIVQRVYKDISEKLFPAAAYNVSHHLEKLAKEKKVKQIQESDTNKYIYIN